MSKHTKGPWIVFKSNTDAPEIWNKHEAITVLRLHNAKADANLIAAAPDLLAHLQTLSEAVRQIVSGTPDRRDWEHLETELVRSEDFIAKAEGKQ